MRGLEETMDVKSEDIAFLLDGNLPNKYKVKFDLMIKNIFLFFAVYRSIVFLTSELVNKINSEFHNKIIDFIFKTSKTFPDKRTLSNFVFLIWQRLNYKHLGILYYLDGIF